MRMPAVALLWAREDFEPNWSVMKFEFQVSRQRLTEICSAPLKDQPSSKQSELRIWLTQQHTFRSCRSHIPPSLTDLVTGNAEAVCLGMTHLLPGW